MPGNYKASLDFAFWAGVIALVGGGLHGVIAYHLFVDGATAGHHLIVMLAVNHPTPMGMTCQPMFFLNFWVILQFDLYTWSQFKFSLGFKLHQLTPMVANWFIKIIC